MNSEGGPKTAPTNAPTTVQRNPDLETWLVTTALDAVMTSGMASHFADQVKNRLSASEPIDQGEIRLDAVLKEVEGAAVDMTACVLLLAYEKERRAPVDDYNVHRLLAIVRDSAAGYYAARRLRLGGESA